MSEYGTAGQWLAAEKAADRHAVHFSSERQDWATPQYLFDALNRSYRFTLDVCADEKNAKCNRWIGFGENGLKHSWKGERAWMNPPYGRSIGDWTTKAAETKAELVCGLLPARTDTAWWHRDVMRAHEIYLLQGRVKFEGAEASAPFPSAVVIWRTEPLPSGERPTVAGLKICPP